MTGKESYHFPRVSIGRWHWASQEPASRNSCVLLRQKKTGRGRRKLGGVGVAGGQPHVHVTMVISLAEFSFMEKGQQVAGAVGKGRFGLVDFLHKFLNEF